jgi:hypothetical protein
MGADVRLDPAGFDIGIRQSWQEALDDVAASGGKPYRSTGHGVRMAPSCVEAAVGIATPRVGRGLDGADVRRARPGSSRRAGARLIERPSSPRGPRACRRATCYLTKPHYGLRAIGHNRRRGVIGEPRATGVVLGRLLHRLGAFPSRYCIGELLRDPTLFADWG